MIRMPMNRPLDWGRREWFGNPDNQSPIASYDDGRLHCRIILQSFTCPRFCRDNHFGECYVSFSVWLQGRTLHQSRSFFLGWNKDDADVRAKAEAAYGTAVFYANKVTNKRPKEVIDWLVAKIKAAIVNA